LKIKLLNWLLIIDILTLFLVLSIAFVPSSVIRIIIGLPFLLFFPGYVVIAALFPTRKDKIATTDEEPSDNVEPASSQSNKKGIDGIERIALSFGMSIAIVALIGLGLNYTPWGIRLAPVLISISAFIVIMSILAFLREYKLFALIHLTTDLHIKIPGCDSSPFNKLLTIILIVSILGAIGVLGYAVAAPKVGEKFSEFYILGSNGEADAYPTVFYMKGNLVVGVQYSDNETVFEDAIGQVTVGIINHEQQTSIYSIAITIDGQPANIYFSSSTTPRLGQLVLPQEGKWEQKIGFAPLHVGDNQKVEFLLYKDNNSKSENALHFWVNVKEQY
jgi:uncharacterized membrane protein